MNASQVTISIRPVPGRAFVRASFCDGLGMPSTKLNPHLTASCSTQASLWIGTYEDQVPPGGGCA